MKKFWIFLAVFVVFMFFLGLVNGDPESEKGSSEPPKAEKSPLTASPEPSETPSEPPEPEKSASEEVSEPSKAPEPAPEPEKPAPEPAPEPEKPAPEPSSEPETGLEGVEIVHSEAPGYDRDLFASGWKQEDGCDTRDEVLNRDLIVHETAADDCSVVTGTLHDPYTGAEVAYSAPKALSVHVDHVVSLSMAWKMGADEWSDSRREAFYNDTSNLLAVKGSENMSKSDSGPSEWLPDVHECSYARIYADTTVEYDLGMTQADHDALTEVLESC